MTDKEAIFKVKTALLNQIKEGEFYPYVYSVVQYGFYDDTGDKRCPDAIRKFWDKEEVKKTHRIMRNMIKEAFNIDACWIFMERHSPLLDSYGEIEREGRFHTNLISSSIKDNAIEEPNRKCKRLFNKDGSMGVPIQNISYTDIDDLKTDLVNACLRQADWVNRYSYSLKTQLIYDKEDLERVVFYCLKDYNIKSGLDFMDIVDFSNSDFYKP